MAAKHRVTASSQQRRFVRRRMSGLAAACDVVSASMLCAAVLAVLMVNAQPGKPTVEATQGPPSVSQPVRQQGTVIAVSAGSVTARSANGYTQTYLVTPNTTVITHGGTQPATTTSHFTVNDEVDIVGTIEGGTALATAVADRGVGPGDGRPMDYLEGQPVTTAPGNA